MNNVALMGRLTKDPEMSFTKLNGTVVAKFTLAVDRQFSQEKQADFINCVAWRKTAEFVCKYFTKGQKIALVGRIQTRKWEDDDSKMHYASEVIAESVYFAESRKEAKGELPEPEYEHPENDEEGLPF